MMRAKMLPPALFYVNMTTLKYQNVAYPIYSPGPQVINNTKATLLAEYNIADASQWRKIMLNALNDKNSDSIVMNGIQDVGSHYPGVVPDLTKLYKDGTKIARGGVLMTFLAPVYNRNCQQNQVTGCDEARVEEGSIFLWSIGIPSYRITNIFADNSADGQLGYFITKSDLDLLA